jgi:hypothetical protein
MRFNNLKVIMVDESNQDECGTIYAWGLNENGFLGVDATKKQGE